MKNIIFQRKKKHNKKINLLFLINDMFINNFISIYEEIKKSNDFNMIVITCDSLETTNKEKTSSDKIYNYLVKNNIECIDSYDKKNKKLLSLNQFEPDYIFVSNPYDIYRPSEYSSYNLSKIAKLCSIEYGAIIVKDINKAIVNNDFYKNCYMNFISSEKELDLSEEFENSSIKEKFVPIGCIKLDKYLFNKNKEKKWNILFSNEMKTTLRIVWKPRWTLEKKDDFLSFLESFIKYSKNNNVQLLLLEHPLLKSNLKHHKILDKYEKLIKNKGKNFVVYNKSDFLDYVLESDVLIGENTSLMSEYSITNNPIILVGNYDKLNSLGKVLIDKEKTASEFKDIIERLNDIKVNRKIKYENLRLFKPPKNRSSAQYLLSLLKKDYYDENNNANYFRKMLVNDQIEINKIKKILIQGYYEDILNKDIAIFNDISNGLKNWSDEITKLKSKDDNYY